MNQATKHLSKEVTQFYRDRDDDNNDDDDDDDTVLLFSLKFVRIGQACLTTCPSQLPVLATCIRLDPLLTSLSYPAERPRDSRLCALSVSF